MACRLRGAENVRGGRLARQRPGDRLLGRLVVVVEDLLVVGGFPVDEDTHEDAEVIDLALSDHALADRVDDRTGDRRLSRAEHLHRLGRALDRDLVRDVRVRLGRKVRCHDREEVRVALLLVDERLREGVADRPFLRPDDEIDVGDLVALADQGLADHEARHARISSFVVKGPGCLQAAVEGPAEVGRASYTMPRMPVKQASSGREHVAFGAGREAVAGAAQLACVLEVSAEKPGNITPRHDFDDTSYEDMLRSAIALGPEMGRAGDRGVGETVLAAVRATRSVAGANTNLGIALLLAPLARAAARRESVGTVLEGLTVDDARAAYEAIRVAGAGGLDEPVEHDVRDEPTVTLRE